MRFSNKTLAVLAELKKEMLDYGYGGFDIVPVDEHEPIGKLQECDATDQISQEWVNQRQYAEDSFVGTVTWKMGDYYIITHFDC